MINQKHCCLEDYALISVIGKGNYAKVVLVRNRHDQKVYAMKVLKKKMILQMNQTQHIMNEKTVLANISNPFLVNLKASFQDEKKLYFVLQYCPGGELFGLLSIKNRLSQQQTKFFAAQIVLALQELHKNGVIYRDLKPQNVLLDKNGYIKLTDFGLSKLIKFEDELTMSVCGTPQYLAPQILYNKGHGLAVDWWCLGCIIYEMVRGYPPFSNDNRMTLFDDIKYKGFKMPEVSDKMQGLFYGLLQKNPQNRLGAKGAEQVKSHPFFEKINWTGLKAKNIKAPFVPILSSDSDISNFDPQFTGCTVQSYSESKQSSQMMDVQINQDHFADFEFGAQQ